MGCMMNSGGSKEKNTECVVENSVATTKYPSELTELHLLGMTFKSREELLCCTKSFYSKQGYSLAIKDSKKERFLVLGCEREGIYRGIPLEGRKNKFGTRPTDCPFELRGKKNVDGFWVLQMKNSSHNHEASFDTPGRPSRCRLSKEQILEIEKLTRAGVQSPEILSALRLRHKNVDIQAVSKTIDNVKTKIKKDALPHRTAVQALFDEIGQEIDLVLLKKEIEARMEKSRHEADDADSKQELEAQNEARAPLQIDCPSGSAPGASIIRSGSGRNHETDPVPLQKEVEAQMEKRQRETNDTDSRQKELEARNEARALLQTVCPSGSALGDSINRFASGRNHEIDTVSLKKEVGARMEKRQCEADDADSRQKELEARNEARAPLQTDCPSDSSLGDSIIRSASGRNREIDHISILKEIEAWMEKRRREADDADSRQELEARNEARARLQTDCPSGSALGASIIRYASGRNHDEEPQIEGATAQGTTSVPDLIGSLDKERENSMKFNYDENVLALRDTRDSQEIFRGLTKHIEGAIYAASLLEPSTSSRAPEPDKEKDKDLIEELRILRSGKVKWKASSKKFKYLYQTSSKRLEEEKARGSGLQTAMDHLEANLASAKYELEEAQEAWRCEKAAYEEKIQSLRDQAIEAVIGTRDQGEEANAKKARFSGWCPGGVGR